MPSRTVQGKVVLQDGPFGPDADTYYDFTRLQVPSTAGFEMRSRQHQVERHGAAHVPVKLGASPRSTRTRAAGLLWLSVIACADDAAAPPPVGPAHTESTHEEPGIAGADSTTGRALGAGDASGVRDANGPGDPADDRARPALCARERDDAVRDVFCAPTPPAIRGLSDLQASLGVSLGGGTNGGELLGGPNVAVLSHSTALSGRRVSPINPRLIITAPSVLMAYQRGVQKVELIAAERGEGSLNFYLIRFEQACSAQPKGCLPGDLYTPRIERDWRAWRIEDDEDLKNTPDDCRQCHQRDRDRPGLLMRELNNPWTHFMQPIDENPLSEPGPGVQGQDLMRDYLAAKGDERYGGFSMAWLTPIAPFFLEGTVGVDQPVLFDAPGIEHERFPHDPQTGYPKEPGPSPTWEEAYAAFKRGEQLALPYLEPRAADVDKLSRLGAAYTRYRTGELPAEELPELSDVFPDDPLVRARIGLETEPGADAVDVLIQACGSCHNDVLDQSISRARFNVNLWQADPDEIETAIARIERAPGDPGVMPPPEARQLSAEGRQRLLEYLRADPLTQAPEQRLVRAAQLGMAGGADRRVFEPR